MSRTILAFVALSFCVLRAGATPVLPAGPVQVGPSVFYCIPETGTGISMQDCQGALSRLPPDAFHTLHEFSPTSQEREFQLPRFFWRGSCGMIVNYIESGVTIVTNYATILAGVDAVLTKCVSHGGVGGCVDNVRGLSIIVLNPATAHPGVKQTWDRCIGRVWGVDVPPECTSSAQFAQLVRDARATAPEQQNITHQLEGLALD